MQTNENNKPRGLYCYSKDDFIKVVYKNGWTSGLPDNVAVISIGSLSEDDEPHFFEDSVPGVFNVNFDDIDPEVFWRQKPGGENMYDAMMQLYLDERKANTHHKTSNENFMHVQYIKNDFSDVIGKDIIYTMNYEQADKMERFIDDCVNKGLDIYVHCAAGASRSQGVVRYILDTYPDINWQTRKANECRTPNVHVVRMLKRAHMFNTETLYDSVSIEDVKQKDIWRPITKIEPFVETDPNTKEEYVRYRLIIRGKDEFILDGAEVIGLSMDARQALSKTIEEIKNP